MEEVNYIPGDKVIISFIVKNILGKIYNIENFSSLSTVYTLKTVLAEMTTYSAGWMFLYYCGFVIDNFVIDYYGLEDWKNILLCPHLRGGVRTRSTFRRLQVIIRDVSVCETE